MADENNTPAVIAPETTAQDVTAQNVPQSTG